MLQRVAKDSDYVPEMMGSGTVDLTYQTLVMALSDLAAPIGT